jgi:hypothetical protein
MNAIMENHLHIYNSNDYERLCNKLIHRLEDAISLMKNMVKFNKPNKEAVLLTFYREIFDYPLMKKYLRAEISGESEAGDVSLKFHFLMNELVEIDRIFHSNLANILEAYLLVFNYLKGQKEQLGRELMLELTEIKGSLGLTFDFIQYSYRERDSINRKETLKKDKIQNLPFEGFYHFTHISNIPNILKMGLLSHEKLSSSGVQNSDYSNKEIKSKRERKEEIYGRKINEYVPLYINPKNPFMGSKAIVPVFSEMVLIEVLPHVLVQITETLFSDGNAAMEETKLYDNIEKFDVLDWKQINDGLWAVKTDSQRIMCSEVLVPDEIAPYYMQRIIVQNKSVLHELMAAFPNKYGIEIILDSDYFAFPRIN